jgi:hypothetical protein
LACPGPSSCGDGVDPTVLSVKRAGHVRPSPGLSRHDSRSPPHAELGEDESPRERRKGDPAARRKASGLRRVYGDGVEIGAEGRQETRDGHASRSATTKRDEEDRKGVTTPPIHAIMDENPWA